MKQIKIIIISAVYPYPADNGKKVVLSGIINYLKERHGHTSITYIFIAGNKNITSVRNDHFGKLIVLKKPGFFTQIWNIAWFVIIKKAKSIQEAFLYSTRLGKSLRYIIETVKPELIIYDTVRIGQYRQKGLSEEQAGSTHVLYMEDLFSIRYQKMVETLETYPSIKLNPLGNFISFIPFFLKPFAQMNFIQKQLLKMESNLIKKSEHRYLELFDQTLLLNEKEVNVLENKRNSQTIRSIKPLLQIEKRNKIERRYKGDPSFVFLGDLSYPQNEISIKYFLKNYMDLMIKKMPNIKFKIVGRGGNVELTNLVKKYKNHISMAGYVPDLDDIFSKSCAMVVPLLFGSGIKLKILEAFSYGLPVICTDIGVEGIQATNGIHCIVENDLSSFPDIMASLCDIEKNKKMSQSAYDFFLTNYSKQAVTKEYDNLFNL